MVLKPTNSRAPVRWCASASALLGRGSASGSLALLAGLSQVLLGFGRLHSALRRANLCVEILLCVFVESVVVVSELFLLVIGIPCIVGLVHERNLVLQGLLQLLSAFLGAGFHRPCILHPLVCIGFGLLTSVFLGAELLLDRLELIPFGCGKSHLLVVPHRVAGLFIFALLLGRLLVGGIALGLAQSRLGVRSSLLESFRLVGQTLHLLVVLHGGLETRNAAFSIS